jgi:hypothetical protein
MAAKKWPSCNVFHTGAEQHQVWHFDLKGKRFVPKGGQTLPAGRPMPPAVAGKTWQSLLQPRLNVAWLPSEEVFLRVVQLPQCPPTELSAMVELQLEKLSPMPVAQLLWNAITLGEGAEGMQTVLVVMAERAAAEAFLGRLETAGLFTDRLDCPAVDQLMALKPDTDGAWILPDLSGAPDKALVAWWSGGILRSLGLIQRPADGNAAGALRDQLLQMAWAGEVEGWLTQSPRWHLVAGEETQAGWLSALKEGLGEEIVLIAPASPEELALSCANRAAQSGDMIRGLLPADFALRYRQQFTDRLWMGSLGAVLGIYVLGVLAYFAVLGVEGWRLRSVEKEVARLGPAYTNALDLKATFDVLNDLQELKYAALDCWKLTAELLPSEVVLDGMNFSDGSKLTLNGTVPENAVDALIDFSAALRNVKVDGKPLFDPGQGEQLSYKKSPRAAEMSWNFSLVLRRSEVR